jgi:hypothetical protein
MVHVRRHNFIFILCKELPHPLKRCIASYSVISVSQTTCSNKFAEIPLIKWKVFEVC